MKQNTEMNDFQKSNRKNKLVAFGWSSGLTAFNADVNPGCDLSKKLDWITNPKVMIVKMVQFIMIIHSITLSLVLVEVHTMITTMMMYQISRGTD